MTRRLRRVFPWFVFAFAVFGLLACRGILDLGDVQLDDAGAEDSGVRDTGVDGTVAPPDTGPAPTATSTTDATVDADAPVDVLSDTGEKEAAPDAPVEAAPEACSPETDAAFCVRLGKNCGAVSSTDNCGALRTVLSCGLCTISGQSCGAVTPNVCGCPAEGDLAFCLRLGKNCGAVSSTDNCGNFRAVASCGFCTPSTIVCGAALPNVCGCGGETNDQLCARYGKDCGSFTALDNCGISRTISCGTCTTDKVCGARVANVCGTSLCVPETSDQLCGRYGKNCGQFSQYDNCGVMRTVQSCGGCSPATIPNDPSPPLSTCGLLSSSPNVCCVPESDTTFCARQGKNCGTLTSTDSCGRMRQAICGTCAPSSTVPICGAQTANVCGAASCSPESDPQFCLRFGKSCGTFSSTDNCGTARTVTSCGTCTLPSTCSSTNVCSCAAEDDPTFCARQGRSCGMFTGADNCGAARTANCGSCPTPGVCGAVTANQCTNIPYWTLDSPTTANYSTTTEIIDNTSGLHWRLLEDAQMNFVGAQNTCSGYGAGNAGAWRVPSALELMSILDYSVASHVNANVFPNTAGGKHWTITPYYAATSTYGWTINFTDGTTLSTTPQTQAWPVRCVSGGPLDGLTLAAGNDTVYDPKTQLTWQRVATTQTYSASGAATYCQALVLGGLTGWRVPRVKELFALINTGTATPAIDTNAFPNAPSAIFITATVFPSLSTLRYTIDFGSGQVDVGQDSSLYRVRCVR